MFWLLKIFPLCMTGKFNENYRAINHSAKKCDISWHWLCVMYNKIETLWGVAAFFQRVHIPENCWMSWPKHWPNWGRIECVTNYWGELTIRFNSFHLHKCFYITVPRSSSTCATRRVMIGIFDLFNKKIPDDRKISNRCKNMCYVYTQWAQGLQIAGLQIS